MRNSHIKLSRKFHFLAVFGLIWLTSSIRCDGGEMEVVVEAPSGWVANPPAELGGRPSILFKAPGERDAALLVNEMGPLDPKMLGAGSVEALHFVWFKKLHGIEADRDNCVMFKTDHGEFWMSVYEDPKLIGKPIVKGDYKYIVQFTGLIDGKHVVSGGILTQEKTGADLDEAKAALGLIRAK